MPLHNLLLLLLLLGWPGSPVTFAAESDQPAPITTDTVVITTANNDAVAQFRVELADTPARRRQGLMHRSNLAVDAGMLFDYEHEQPVQMWMKNTAIPLDMLFINGRGRVVQIVEHTEPHSLRIIKSNQPVRAVLELNAGSAAAFGIGIGARVQHRIFNTSQKQK